MERSRIAGSGAYREYTIRMTWQEGRESGKRCTVVQNVMSGHEREITMGVYVKYSAAGTYEGPI